FSPFFTPAAGAIAYDSICCMPYNDRAAWLDDLYTHLILHGDSVESWDEIQKIKAYPKTNNSEEFELEAMMLEVQYLEYLRWNQQKYLLSLIEEGVKRSLNLNNKMLAVRFLSVQEHYAGNTHNYSLSFAASNEMERQLDAMPDQSMYHKAFFRVSIAHVYYNFGELPAALARLRELIDYQGPASAKDMEAIWHAHNTMGLYHRKMQQYDSSNYYFDKGRHLKYIQENKPLLYAMSTGNLGINYY